jgi:hypothetical protein
MKPNRIAAFAAWLLSVWFTALLFASAGELPILGIGGLLALALQAMLTIAERPIWRYAYKRNGGKILLMGVLITLADGVLLNGAGIYPAIGTLTKTPVGFMLTDSLALAPTIDKVPAAVIAAFIGTVVAGLAEYLWELSE